jgi:hypothetical protein
MSVKRSDFMGLWFMPEASVGVDPGIVAAPSVDGASETYMLQPDATHRAFARMKDKPSGLPVLPLADIPQVFTTHNYATCKVPGIKDPGDVTFTFTMHGGIADYGTSGNTGRTQPPPWLRLGGSGLGKFLGNLAAHSGGASTTVASATDSDTFVLTAGVTAPAHVVAVDGPGSATSYEIIRPTSATGSTVSAAAYHGVTFGLTQTPAAADPAHFSCQIACDQRYETVGETFTLLLQRADSKATIKFVGARCSGWEITSKVGEIDTISVTMTYTDYEYVNDAIDPEPSYYEELWPCAQVTKGARLWLTWDMNANGVVDATDLKRDLEVESFTARWTSGLERRRASTAANGIADISAKQPSMFEIDFSVVYNQEFQELLGLCCSEAFGNLTLQYWVTYNKFIRTSATALRKGAWFICVPSLHQKQDPGTEGEVDNLMYQTIMMETADWQGDAGAFATTTHVDTLFLAGIV